MKNNSNDSNNGGILESILRGISEMFALVQKMENTGQTEIKRSGTFGNLDNGKGIGGCYGFTLKTGLTGKSPVHKEDTAGASQDIPVNKREPLTDIFDEGRFIRVVTEVPAVSEEDIVLHLKGNVLYLTVWGKDRPYNKTIELPHRVKQDSMRKSIRNGILEVVLDIQD